ncbi:hypothetical protein [Geodermatophilus pulveris]|uniref:hypothetical protein n=1 Tax=Geodermatophilus pulveris TaxID=1564159 RepID=UPI001179C00C|nr:hypothetical protein [Geodermatophilus pulveris]
MTLAGTGSSVAVPGGVLTLDAVRDGRAAIRVDGRDVTCREGQRASAGPVPLTCTAVTGDAVTLTVPIG